MEKVDVSLRISQEAAQVLIDNAPGERKRGEWLSELLENYGSGKLGNEGVLERMDLRLRRIEQAIYTEQVDK